LHQLIGQTSRHRNNGQGHGPDPGSTVLVWNDKDPRVHVLPCEANADPRERTQR
jgi:hypothetical protein